jgi:radical SAM protein with 4Fe4S-binding SPASM domain
VRAPPSLPGSYLVLETTNRCSLACVHCTVSEAGHPHHAEVGFLSLATVEALLADLVRVGASFDTLIPFWLGEPLVHRDFGAIYQAALRACREHAVFRRVELHTNATHLTRDRVRVALNAAPVPQTWHLTLDADTPATYLRVKGRDRFEEVVRHVEHFLTEKARTRAPWPRPVLQFILGRNNAHEARAFRDRWTAVCARLGLPVRVAAQEVPSGEDVILYFRQLDAPTPHDQAAENAVYRETLAALGVPLSRPDRSPTTPLDGPNSVPCACFWKSPVVAWDGTVTTCTRDNRLGNALGNLHATPFSELWWGPRARGWRAQAARGDYAGLAPCRDCFIPRSANSTDISVEEIARWELPGAPAGST